ncbi:MAG TPA: penicillin-binding protein activator [Allosphingosinicella sp.]|jgi:ABC-type branched-subunit amino acid transport system substrate-binding protein
MAEQRKVGQARRSALALGFGLNLLLGGCAIVPDPAAPQASAGPAQVQAPPQAQPAPIRPAPSPAQPVLPAADMRNRVAVLVPLTGANAGVGQSIANAANLALADSGGERIRITTYDTAKGAAAAADQALAEGNRFFLGPLLADDVRTIAPLARGARVPVVAFSNDVSVAGNGVYLMGFVPGQSIERVVSYARGQGVQRFAGLIPSGVYGQRASGALITAVERAGGRMVAMQTYARSPASVRAAVGRLDAQSGYDAVLIADGGRMAAVAASAIRSGPSRAARILGTELWAAEADLASQSALHGAWFAAAPGGMFDQLGTRYRARYGSNPYRLASLGYDAVLMTVRVAAGWPAGQPFPEQALRTQAFTGIDGPFRFWRDGIADRSLEVQQVGPAGVTTVSAAITAR